MGVQQLKNRMLDPKLVRKNLGERVRYLRREKGWSQERFAYESGIGRSFMGAIERGEKDIRIQSLCKLASMLDISLSTLFHGTDQFVPRTKRKSKR